ncbi:alpha/beta hydrolase [Alteromonas oceanisediminis]|uniref:alpha/beta hydrolase n=1 Tax=Alteromonas oceanisediminis TaxID=2836180 RepID=UPI001BDA4954|nr:alpha/beta fold hydrolase [Alteromonas oceanisediminis]MBT0586799.1 alpha/beta fold hydrolase [Alteromonas oceanisediminis]
MTEERLPFVDVPAQGTHRATVIWLHGLGDSGNGFAPIVPELKLPANAGVRFIFPHAPVRPVTINNGMPMRAWYDIKSLDFDSRADITGVEASAAQVEQLIDDEINAGISAENIIIAGFSQGGVIALHLATRSKTTFAGVLALSTYMAEPEKLADKHTQANINTPMLLCHGQQDEVVPLFLGHAAFKSLTSLGFKTDWKEYSMQHNVCAQEIQDISQWLRNTLTLN